MMRRLFYTAILSLAAGVSTAIASPVDRTAAENIAKAYFGSKTVSMVWYDEVTKSDALSAPSYYAFNNPSGGWVIVAGDDCCEPVLAYSYTGSFSDSDLPENFKAWMSGISRNVNLVRKAGLEPQRYIAERWETAGGTKEGTVEQNLLETASWGQESPFNDKCPKYKNKSCMTGCVATAMATVLRHNRYPEKGKGTIPSYKTESNNISVPSITLGAAYDWDNMPLTYSSSATTAQKEAVATLMYHCGAMVEMDYDPDGSGAYSSNIVPALTNYLGYSKTAREIYRSNYSNNDWFQLMKAEIDADRAVIYGAADSNNECGHQFVLDGYDSNRCVHINWGWSGQCNAWYAVNYLGDTSSSGVGYVFSYGDSAIVGLAPDESGPSTSVMELQLESDQDGNLFGMTLASGTIGKGSAFSLNIGYICSYDCNNAYNGALRVGLYDRNGALKEYVTPETELKVSKAKASSGGNVTPGDTVIEGLSCTISKDVAFGDYLMASYRLTDGSWTVLGGYSSDEFTSDEYHTNYKLGAIDQAYLDVPSTVTDGQMIYFEMVGSHKLPSTVKWYWDDTLNTRRSVTAAEGSHSLKAVINYTDGSSETLYKTIKVSK